MSQGMRVFLDANVLVSVLNKEYPLFYRSAPILSLAGQTGFHLFTSPVCLAIGYYFAGKKNRKLARRKIAALCRQLKIAPVTVDAVFNTASNRFIHDFEDGMEYYAAMEAGCKCIVTEDTDDFYFSAIEVLSCAQFLEKYLVVD